MINMRHLKSPTIQWVGFIVMLLWVIRQGQIHFDPIFNDVHVYYLWVLHGLDTGEWPVLHYDWVYPAAALIPITLPILILPEPWVESYRIWWSLLVILCNIAGFWFLVKSGKHAPYAAWWWLAYLAALGPIWLTRLEGIIAPMILIALLQTSKRPRAAVAIATLGAWIKIAPGAVVIALAATSRSVREFFRNIAVPGAVVSAIIIILALSGGAGSRVLSVFGEQGTRSLQVESVAATWFTVTRLWDPSVVVAYNDVINTFEVQGDAARSVAVTLDYALLLAVLALAVLTWLATRKCYTTPNRQAQLVDILLISTTTLMAALIVFNKVGSPQFMAWLGPCVAAGISLASEQTRRCWRPAAVMMLIIGGLTAAIYPIFYFSFIDGEVPMTLVVTLRNLLLIALMVWGVLRLVLLARVSANAEKPAPRIMPAKPG